MKDYLVFLGENYYPYGGWEDFSADFDSLEESINYIKSHDGDIWAHVVYKNKIIKNAISHTKNLREYSWKFMD